MKKGVVFLVSNLILIVLFGWIFSRLYTFTVDSIYQKRNAEVSKAQKNIEGIKELSKQSIVTMNLVANYDQNNGTSLALESTLRT